MIRHEWRSAAVPAAPAGTFTKAMGPNSQRVALHVYGDQSTATPSQFNISSVQGSGKIWGGGICPGQHSFPWRDWGPVICDEVWILTADNTASFIVTEIYRLPVIA